MDPRTVLLIDEQTLFRKGVAQLIQMNSSFAVAGETSSGRDGVEMAIRLSPDVVLIDFNMPDITGVETLELMRRSCVNSRFIMLSKSDDESDVVASLRAGAHGYLLKDIEPEDLYRNLERSLTGVSVFSESVTGCLARALSGPQRPQPNQTDLTARELEVVDCLVGGLCNKAIARKLDISVGTVKVHVKHVLHKLDLHSRLEAVAWRHEHGGEKAPARRPQRRYISPVS